MGYTLTKLAFWGLKCKLSAVLIEYFKGYGNTLCCQTLAVNSRHKKPICDFVSCYLFYLECPSPKYGSDCSMNCRTCWNGGICAADNGVCLCHPGFAGDQCERRK